MATAKQLRAEDGLRQLTLMNRAFNGGDGAKEVQQALRQDAAEPPEPKTPSA